MKLNRPRQKAAEKADKKTGKVKDDNGILQTPPIRNIILKDARDVRRLLSSLINELRLGKADVARARTIIYGSQVLLNVIEQTSLEDRLSKLEATVGRT